MGTKIYYFSGTGNSLHVATELQKRIPETDIISMVSLLKNDIIKTGEQAVGFVFPIHLAMSPVPVRKFLGKLDLESAEYTFAVVTRAGSQHRAFKDIEKILHKKGKSLDSHFNLNMASNDPKFEGFKAATEEEIADLESEVQNKLDSIQKVIINKEKIREKDTDFTVQVHAFSLLSLVLPILNGFYNVEFYVNSKCMGCGTCEKVCLSGKIRIMDEKPVWQKDIPCFSCHACLNYCPEQAVQIKSNRFLKSYTEKNGRYSHPYATADDIAGQK